MPPRLVTAIDIGSESAKIVAVRRRGAVAQLIGLARVNLQDLDRSTPDYGAQIAARVRQAIKKQRVPVGHVVTNLGSRGSMVRYLSMPIVPPWKLALVMNYEVEEQIAAAGVTDEVAFDYRILNIPGHSDDQFPLLLALGQVPLIEERLSLARQAARRVDDIDLGLVGCANLLRRSGQCGEEEIGLTVAIGAAEVQIVLQEGANLLFARTVSSGARRMTLRLQKSLALDPGEAERIFTSETRILTREEEEGAAETVRLASQSCRAEAASLAAAVKNSLRFFHDQFHLKPLKISRVFLTGGAARLPGLDRELGEQLGLECALLDVRRACPPACPAALAAVEGGEIHHYSEALGMALARLDEGGFGVSLLPPRVRARREFWAKTVYSYYAAALGVVVLVLLILGQWRNYATREERNRLWTEQVATAKSEHEQLKKLEAENADLLDRVEALDLRANSGRDLIECLRHLQHLTPREVFFTRLITAQQPDAAETADSRSRRRGATTAAAPTPRRAGEVSFQDSRVVEIEGYVVGAPRPFRPAPEKGPAPADKKRKPDAGKPKPGEKVPAEAKPAEAESTGGVLSEQAAIQRLVALADQMQALPFFSSVRPIRQTSLPADDPQLQAAYALRLFGEDENDVRAFWQPPSQGAALSFALRCEIAK